MDKKFALVTMLFVAICNCQNDQVFIELNYNTFSHSSLEIFQNEFIEDIPEVPIQINDNFPSNIGLTIGYKLSQIKTSLFVSYNSTGGKISYSDYSGVIRVTQPLNAVSLGGEYHINLSQNPKGFDLGLRGGIMLSNLKIESYSRIQDNVVEDNLKFQSINLGIGARLNYNYPISFFIIKASVGYDITFAGELRFTENSELHLENNQGEKVKTNWSGLRTSLGVAIPI